MFSEAPGTSFFYFYFFNFFSILKNWTSVIVWVDRIKSCIWKPWSEFIPIFSILRLLVPILSIFFCCSFHCFPVSACNFFFFYHSIANASISPVFCCVLLMYSIMLVFSTCLFVLFSFRILMPMLGCPDMQFPFSVSSVSCCWHFLLCAMP